MNASYNWLKAFVPFPQGAEQLRDLITMRTATVDDVERLRADLAPIVVARVVEAQRHPDSAKLSVTKVDAGGGTLLDVVCGAPNVAAGKLYPFAPVGTTMPDGLKIERRKIRGAVSEGMLCSARELKLGDAHEGILELDVAAAPGTPFLTAVPVGDVRLVIDVLPNRPDLLSHVGIAREIAAATGLPLGLPEIPLSSEVVTRPTLVTDAPPVGVLVEDTVGAPRYVGVTLRGVTVGPSPRWLVDRLEGVGARSINNVVDATNYVMHELGQPMHAFDADRLAGRRIVVRRARAGERLVTLDGVDRALDPEMTVIADAERAVAVGGVMGGRDSEVTESTTTLFLESAAFDPRRIRRTRRALGLSTDASYRFERGVDTELARFALDRLVRVIHAVAGGGQISDVVDLYPAPAAERAVELRVARVARLLGDEVRADEIERVLSAVGFGVREVADGVLRVAVPSWRADVRAEVDLIEEVARLRGYETFSDTLRPYRPSAAPDDPRLAVSERLRVALTGAGLYEVRPMPFVAAAAETERVRVRNPLAENEAYLRDCLLDTLGRRAEFNLAHMTGDVRLFEIGTVFHPDTAVRSPSGHALPREELRVAALVMGRRRPAHFTEPEPPSYDEWDAKALAETIMAAAFPSGSARLVAAHAADVLWDVLDGDAPAGAVRRMALDAPVWAAPAFGVEVTIAMTDSRPVAAPGSNAHDARGNGASGRMRATTPVYRPLPTTPAAEFDLALLVPDELPGARVEQVLRQAGGELLERVELLSEFRGGNVPAGQRSLAWRLTFRHPQRTLGGKEVEGRRSQLLKRLESDLGIRPRQ